MASKKRKGSDEVSPIGKNVVDFSKVNALIPEGSKNKYGNLFHNRFVLPPGFCKLDDARSLKFNFWEKLEFQGLKKFVECNAKYHVPRVKAVFCELKYNPREKGLSSKLSNNKTVSFAPEDWKNLFDLEWSGPFYSSHESTEGMNKAVFIREITKSSATLTNSSQISVSKLKVEARMLFWVQTKILDPRKGNYSMVYSEDLPLLWILWNRKKINWPQLFCEIMMNVHNDKSKPICYCSQIGVFLQNKRLLERVKLDEPGEDSGFSQKLVHRMHYYEDLDSRKNVIDWYYQPSRNVPIKIYDDRVVHIGEGSLNLEAEDAEEMADAEDMMIDGYHEEEDEDYVPPEQPTNQQVMDQIADLKQFMIQGFANINRRFDSFRIDPTTLFGPEPETYPQPHHDQDHNN
ncbi:hypothetical protein P8452_62406 [Trifolium repens]|jgi:hypothetical protein|nr:hypothetical protein QL285_099171 [Trifolium repens]KAK2417989.1 hypothetical protein QL285_040226 [Trifolium repens]KAK2418106.1 hypothetical protein QL285_040335 [Trifolium repens]KAK2418137.1 hypothetical protein QL285_040361 [Trifolium repens]KAK2418141.1 hypothetical protein QL285_040365 [Trifolium repens]